MYIFNFDFFIEKISKPLLMNTAIAGCLKAGNWYIKKKKKQGVYNNDARQPKWR